MKLVAALLLVLFLLLGVQRTPEAMVDPSPIIGGVIIPAAGCVHAAATRTHQQPTVPLPTEEAPATIP